MKVENHFFKETMLPRARDIPLRDPLFPLWTAASGCSFGKVVMGRKRTTNRVSSLGQSLSPFLLENRELNPFLPVVECTLR